VRQVEQLLESGIKPDSPDDDGWTPLHFAAQGNASVVMTMLLDAGAPVDARDRHGNTPLSTAVFNSRGDGEVIALLRRRGADPYARNNHGVSPVKLARTIGNYDVRQFFSDLPDDSDRQS